MEKGSGGEGGKVEEGTEHEMNMQGIMSDILKLRAYIYIYKVMGTSMNVQVFKVHFNRN